MKIMVRLSFGSLSQISEQKGNVNMVYLPFLLFLNLISCFPSPLHAHKPDLVLPLKAINNDLSDGTQVQFRSTKLNKYLCSENGGGTVIVANRPSASGWETFRLWRVKESYFTLRVFNKQFVGLESQSVQAVSDTPTDSEIFQIVRKYDDLNRVRLRASNGFFVQAQSETLVTADYTGSSWDDSDPSVFKMTIIKPSQELELPLKAVNLGNWLVTEGWMKPSRFDGIINKDLLDGTQVQFRSTKLNKYLCSENGGGTVIVANRPSASGWETFRLWRVNKSHFNLRVFNKQFVGLRSQGVEAISNTPTNSETFQIVRKYDDLNRVRLRASNGFFLQAQSETLVTADYTGSSWDDSDPSVFKMTIVNVNAFQGEFQITNGYGPYRASQVMQDHWNSYITEQDFNFMSVNGLSAVRIPVGWWIAQDPTPPEPFVGGSSKSLDNAFKVIVDLHAIKASQNGDDHSGSRDGYQEWGESNIDETVQVIEFLAARYGGRPSLGAISLMNEPRAPGVTLDAHTKYYKAGYDAIRKYTNAYVILSTRLGPADPKELFSFASSLNRVAIDVHYYNLFADMFTGMTVQQNIDFVYNQRSSDLGNLMSANRPLLLVGEWTAEFARNDASVGDFQRFAKAQLDVYGRASFGWGYWAYNCDQNHWSLKWMVENNYIKL